MVTQHENVVSLDSRKAKFAGKTIFLNGSKDQEARM